MFDFNPVYLFYLLIGVSAAMFAEGAYLLFYNKSSYRKNINRRLKVMDDKTDRESVLVQLRRERGLTAGGDYRLPLDQSQPARAAVRPHHRLFQAGCCSTSSAWRWPLPAS